MTTPRMWNPRNERRWRWDAERYQRAMREMNLSAPRLRAALAEKGIEIAESTIRNYRHSFPPPLATARVLARILRARLVQRVPDAADERSKAAG